MPRVRWLAISPTARRRRTTGADAELIADDKTFRRDVSRTLSRTWHGDGPKADATAKKLDTVLSSSEGRNLLTGDRVTGHSKAWALSQTMDNPAWTAAALKDGWESDIVGKTHAGPVIAQYAKRNVNAPSKLTPGALANTVGMALNKDRDALPTNEGATQQRAPEENGFNRNYYTNDAQVAKIAGKITALNPDSPNVKIMPITVTNNEVGVMHFNVFEVTNQAGAKQYVDNRGDVYKNLDHWQEKNGLPPGRMAFAAEGADGKGKLKLENTPVVTDSIGEYIEKTGDALAITAGVAAGGIAIAATGGLATPAVAALATPLAVGAGIWVFLIDLCTSS